MKLLWLLQTMLFSPFVLTGVVFLSGLLYLAHGLNMLPALQARALAAAEHIHAVSHTMGSVMSC